MDKYIKAFEGEVQLLRGHNEGGPLKGFQDLLWPLHVEIFNYNDGLKVICEYSHQHCVRFISSWVSQYRPNLKMETNNTTYTRMNKM
jgi:hypothetical protein